MLTSCLRPKTKQDTRNTKVGGSEGSGSSPDGSGVQRSIGRQRLMRAVSTALFCLLPVFVQAAPRLSLEGLGRTPQEEKLLEEISRTIEVYEQIGRAFKREIQLLIEQKYKERRSALGESYEK